mmetsp:Transcript_4365/g.10624  ORF Transcript_4365/g.10624 Transcript_4365/m.10624 type:complete len:252 (+) Transcript_4365:275-1030(+)
MKELMLYTTRSGTLRLEYSRCLSRIWNFWKGFIPSSYMGLYFPSTSSAASTSRLPRLVPRYDSRYLIFPYSLTLSALSDCISVTCARTTVSRRSLFASRSAACALNRSLCRDTTSTMAVSAPPLAPLAPCAGGRESSCEKRAGEKSSLAGAEDEGRAPAPLTMSSSSLATSAVCCSACCSLAVRAVLASCSCFNASASVAFEVASWASSFLFLARRSDSSLASPPTSSPSSAAAAADPNASVSSVSLSVVE